MSEHSAVAAVDPPAAPAAVGFWEAFRFWLKLGFISFGGPAGQIAIMHSELVERRRWISERTLFSWPEVVWIAYQRCSAEVGALIIISSRTGWGCPAPESAAVSGR